MLFLVEQKNKRGVPISSAVVGAYWEPHAQDIYGFKMHVDEDDQITVTPLIKDARKASFYVETNRFGEFVRGSFEKITPSRAGHSVKCLTVDDEITNYYQLTKNTTWH